MTLIETFLLLILLISGTVIIYCYGIYPFILFCLAKCKRGVVPDFTLHSQSSVSIIVAAYNEEKHIAQKIENCLNLEYPKDRLEVIIASDGSTDKTVEISQNYASHGIKVFAFPLRRGKVNLLNDVIPKAKHEIIVLTDANTIFSPGAINKLIRHFTDPRIGAVCGALEFTKPDGSRTAELEGIYWKFETFLKRIEGSFGSLLGANGAIYAIRKSLFEPLPPDTIVEDFIIPMKILEKGYRVVYEPQAFATEEATKHIIQEKTRRIRIGAGDFQALIMLRRLLHPRFGFVSFAFWSHKVLRWFMPFFLFLAFVSNMVLVKFYPNTFYKALFITQCFFYFSAFIGYILSWGNIPIKVFNLCYYFVSMNLALFLGFLRFLTKSQSVTWERTER